LKATEIIKPAANLTVGNKKYIF